MCRCPWLLVNGGVYSHNGAVTRWLARLKTSYAALSGGFGLVSDRGRSTAWFLSARSRRSYVRSRPTCAPRTLMFAVWRGSSVCWRPARRRSMGALRVELARIVADLNRGGYPGEEASSGYGIIELEC